MLIFFLHNNIANFCLLLVLQQVLCRHDEKKVITRIGPGGFFGEIAFIFGGDRAASILAISNVDTLVLHRKDLDDVLKEFPLIQQ